MRARGREGVARAWGVGGAAGCVRETARIALAGEAVETSCGTASSSYHSTPGMGSPSHSHVLTLPVCEKQVFPPKIPSPSV